MMLSVVWTQNQQLALLAGAVVYGLLVIAAHRIAGSERRWREERRQAAAENLRKIVDVERKMAAYKLALERAWQGGHERCAAHALCELRSLNSRLRALRRKQAEYEDPSA